jgi:hypothetical protein
MNILRNPSLSSKAQEREKLQWHKVSTNHTERRQASFSYLESKEWDQENGHVDPAGSSIRKPSPLNAQSNYDSLRIASQKLRNFALKSVDNFVKSMSSGVSFHVIVPF